MCSNVKVLCNYYTLQVFMTQKHSFDFVKNVIRIFLVLNPGDSTIYTFKTAGTVDRL